MILRRYGSTFESVEPNFDSKALNEIAFRRDRTRSFLVEEFESTYRRVDEHGVEAQADGDVQDHTEQVLLDQLEARIREIEASSDEGDVLVVENGPGHDWPKTKQATSNVIVDGENRLHFGYTIAPPIRIGVYRAG